MQIDPGIALSVKPPQMPNIMESAGRILSIKGLIQQQEAQRLQMEQQKADALAEGEIRKALEETGGNVEAALPKIRQIAPKIGLDLEKSIREIKEAGLKMDASQIDLASKRTVRLGQLSAMATDQESYEAVIDQALQEKEIDQETANRLLQMPYDPMTIKKFQLQAMTVEQALGQARVEAEERRKQEEEKRKQELHPLEVQEQRAKATTAERTLPDETTGLTPAQAAQIKAQEANVTETELALRAAKGDVEAGKALGILVQNRIKEDQTKQPASAEETPIDSGSNSILSQTGLSMNAFRYLTGQAGQLPRDQLTRNRAATEAQNWANKKGVDVSTIASQYKTYNDVLSSNISRMNNTKIMESELQGTIENLQGVVNAKDLGRLKIGNVIKIWAGQEINDDLAQQYALHLGQLRNELSAYYAATQGRTGNNITITDLRDAESVIRNGISQGGLAGLQKAIENSTGKMGKVMQRSVDTARKSVWDLFGVGANYRGGEGPDPAPKSGVRVRDPKTGKTGTYPGTAEEAKADGWEVI